LALEDVILVDPAASPISPAAYEVGDGVYQYISPPPPQPWLEVSSKAWDEATANAAGRVFNITVTINDVQPGWHLTGIQFWLEFNTTLLATKSEWIYEGDFLKYFGETFFVSHVEGDVIAGDLQLPPHPGPHGWANGSGVVATIQFEAIYSAPPRASCDLTLFNVLLVDDQALPIEYDHLRHGTYEILVASPPWLSVTPTTVEVEDLGDSFNLNVVINELDWGFHMVGAEFKIHYNTSVLETKTEWITEGTDNIMREVAERTGTDLFFQAYVEEEYGLIGIVILPLPNGTWPFFPEGTGLLANIQFASIYQHGTKDVTTLLILDDILLVDDCAKQIPIDEEKTADGGTCTVTLKKAFVPPPAERLIDLFTQYTFPYGGQGLNMPSDAFAPQGQVELYSKVTYRGDAVPYKPVAYQISGPNDYQFVATEFSDSFGTALLDFSIPASPGYFGLWTITSTVDIAGQVVTDTLVFRVGWLIEVKSITIEPNEGTVPTGEGELQQVYKGNTYEVSVVLKAITMQSPTKCVQLLDLEPKILLGYSGFDELNQPLFGQFFGLNIEPIPFDSDFVLDEADREVPAGKVSITIPRSAYSGVGTIYVNIFTDFLWNQGVPYSDPTTGMKQVWISTKDIPGPTVSEAWLQVSRASVYADSVFNIDITIHDVDPDTHIVGIQFKLEFDTTLLEVESSEDVTEGDFVKQFGETFFVVHVEDNVIIGELQMPPYPGDNGWMRGTGTLATIQFKAIKTGSTFLTLRSASLVDADANPVELRYLIHGYVKVTG
jgi:hypothetical protein